jgi:N-succinyldiaminopimelate aminotransferase
VNPIYTAMGTTIFEEMSTLARERGAINLGQGFPDEEGPEDVRRVAADALFTRSNQYPPSRGSPELRAAVAEHYNRLQGLSLAADEVLVTSGATEALAAAILAIVSPGDEVLLFQPTYDAYLPLVKRAGGVARCVTLRPPGWRLVREEIEAAIGQRTRLLILNDPLNPAARVFDADEIAMLADLCIEHNLVALCDEVWEHILFDGRRHNPLIAEPGMAGRAVKIGSAGKIFSMTGWKVGFVMAAPSLLEPIARAHQFLTFTTPPALQAAVAYGLAKGADWYAAMRARYQASRDRFSRAIAVGGYVVLPSEGSYFVCIDIAASGFAEDDQAFCLRLVHEAGVAAIPVSALYAQDHERRIVRLCFAKADDVLDEAARRLNVFRADHAAP